MPNDEHLLSLTSEETKLQCYNTEQSNNVSESLTVKSTKLQKSLHLKGHFVIYDLYQILMTLTEYFHS